MRPIRMGIVGVGKIARDQHIPSIVANPAFQFAAASSRHAKAEGVRNFLSLQEMLAEVPDLDAISICTPPQTHYETARLALESGKHVLLEKPPCTSLSQLIHLEQLAAAKGLSLYQTEQLQRRRLTGARVVWKEDVRIWHPGQTWIWEAGGFGVLDPGINALSILTRLIPEPIFADAATLYVPSNCETPIAAQISLLCAGGARIAVELDFRHTGTQTWDIDFQTDSGPLKLIAGGGQLTVGHVPAPHDAGKLHSEYVSIYQRFAELVAQRRSEVDARPMQLVADIFLVGKRVSVEPFSDPA
jgi:D-galactose 1-dehydrogenase